MAGRWRTFGIAAAIAVAVTTGVAALVGAEPAPDDGPSSAIASVTTQAPAEIPVATLPSVTAHDLDPAIVAAGQSSPSEHVGQSVIETIQLSIIGGDLQLVTDHTSVTLERVSGTTSDWTGTLPPVRVVDATGSGAGWDVRWMVSSLDVETNGKPSDVPDAKVQLEPGAPVVVAGLADGIVAGKGGPAVKTGRTLFNAQPDSGGGTYEAGGTILVRLPTSIDATSVAVELGFSLG